jgi:hypothetical protein
VVGIGVGGWLETRASYGESCESQLSFNRETYRPDVLFNSLHPAPITRCRIEIEPDGGSR